MNVIEDVLDGDKDTAEPEDARKELHVCPYDKDGKVCSASFDSKVKLNAHTMAVHQVTWDGKPVERGGRKPKDADVPPTKTAATKTEKQAVKRATKSVSPIITDANRAQVYEQSLATIGLLGHLAAGRWFTADDHAVWNAGTPGLANALNDVGDENENIRRACDMILAGGGGGAYVKLILACATIAVPIAANHGMLPQATGQRFGAFIGAVAAQPGPVSSASGTAPSEANVAQATPDPYIPPGNPSEWTYEQWQEILFAVPTSPTAMQVMVDMAGPAAGALGVTIPDMPGTEPMDIPQEEHRGSVGPDTNGTATAEPEPSPQA